MHPNPLLLGQKQVGTLQQDLGLYRSTHFIFRKQRKKGQDPSLLGGHTFKWYNDRLHRILSLNLSTIPYMSFWRPNLYHRQGPCGDILSLKYSGYYCELSKMRKSRSVRPCNFCLQRSLAPKMGGQHTWVAGAFDTKLPGVFPQLPSLCLLQYSPKDNLQKQMHFWVANTAFPVYVREASSLGVFQTKKHSFRIS